MPRAKPGLTRSRIAAQAAKLMADQGIDDFSLAKRKAARQLGLPAGHALPDNEEVEAELRTYRGLFQAEEHPGVVLDLRRRALAAMQYFSRFDPYLTGSVLKGTAGRHSVVNVLLYAANEKEMEFFLLDRQIPYSVSNQAQAGSRGGGTSPVFDLEWDGAALRFELCDTSGQRALRTTRASAPPARAGIDELERLVAGTSLPGVDA